MFLTALRGLKQNSKHEYVYIKYIYTHMFYWFRTDSRCTQQEQLSDTLARELSASLCQALVDRNKYYASQLLKHKSIQRFISTRCRAIKEWQDRIFPNLWILVDPLDVCPMFIAITEGSLSLMTQLIGLGASLRTLSNKNDNALHAVCYSKRDRKNKCEYLLSHDSTLIDGINSFGYLPLHIAAYTGRRDLCDSLINCGADVNPKGCKNRPPLHMATYECQTECISLLLKRGADINARDIDDETAFELIKRISRFDDERRLCSQGTTRFIYFYFQVL